jgi:Ni,Fe-hydrogenase III small subunit
MILEREVPLNLQFQPDKKVLDEGIAKAKAALLNDIKRSIYLYRVDCGGCNGCEIEIFSTITPVFDAERFGIKNTPSPRHADILVYTGAMTRSMRMPAIRAYQGAPDPKLVVSYGACGCTGGIFHDNYCVWGGTDKLFPVDVYIPGCPPSPPQTIYGFAIALGLLGQKLHHSELVEGADEQVPFRFEDIPYKMRVALERKARLYAGYRTGLELAEEFMEALRIEGSGSSAEVDALIARQVDPRRAEVLVQLKAELNAILNGSAVVPRSLPEQASSLGA